jgi:hypothetical protein
MLFQPFVNVLGTGRGQVIQDRELRVTAKLAAPAKGSLEENARLREELRADFTVLQRMLFGRSSKKRGLEP